MNIRNELAQIVSRFGHAVSPSEVPEAIVTNYAHGLETGMWYLKAPRLKDQRLVLHAIAGINCAIEAQSKEELNEAGRVLLGAVMEAMGSNSLFDKITCEWEAGDKVRIVLLKRGQSSRLLGELAFSN